MRLLATNLLLLISATLCFSAASTAADNSALLQGKVVNYEGKPVSGVKIVVHDEDTQHEMNGRSDGQGDFEIEHPQCSTLSFDVFPSEKSGLATAHYAHVAGEISKHFIVQLHRGFHVTGKVMAEGQGIKGMEIRVIGQEGEGSSATVHGGGLTHTKANGEYSLSLTPGKKTLQIKNEIFSNLSPLYQHEFTITGDVRLPDMTLPLSKEK